MTILVYHKVFLTAVPLPALLCSFSVQITVTHYITFVPEAVKITVNCKYSITVLRYLRCHLSNIAAERTVCKSCPQI